MALEVYQTRWITKFRGKACTQQFYWLADNVLEYHPYVAAAEIEANIFVNTDWAFYLLSLQSTQCFLRSFQTWRVLPNWGPSTKNRFTSDQYPGRWVGAMGLNFTTANIAWSYQGDFTGKFQTRIGPIGDGAADLGGWFPLFDLTASAFIAEHVAIRTSAIGLSFRSCALDSLGIAHPITSGTLRYPPGRQNNRRWVP